MRIFQKTHPHFITRIIYTEREPFHSTIKSLPLISSHNFYELSKCGNAKYHFHQQWSFMKSFIDLIYPSIKNIGLFSISRSFIKLNFHPTKFIVRDHSLTAIFYTYTCFIIKKKTKTKTKRMDEGIINLHLPSDRPLKTDQIISSNCTADGHRTPQMPTSEFEFIMTVMV